MGTLDPRDELGSIEELLRSAQAFVVHPQTPDFASRWAASASASNQQVASFGSVNVSQSGDRHLIRSRRWLREVAAIGTAAAAFAVVALVLVTILRPSKQPASSALPVPEQLYVISLAYSGDSTVSGRVTAVDSATGASLYTRDLSPNPDAALSPDGTRLYSVLGPSESGGGERLIAVDTATGSDVWSAPISDRRKWILSIGPSALAVSGDGAHLYVASYDQGGERRPWIQVFDTTSGAKAEEFTAPECPAQLFAAPNGQSLYFVCIGNGGLFYVDLMDETHTIHRLGDISSTPMSSVGAAATSDGDLIYVVSSDLRVMVIDTALRSITQQVILDAGEQPLPRLLRLVTLSSNGSTLFVGVRTGEDSGSGGDASGLVAAFDTVTWNHVGQLAITPEINAQSLVAVDQVAFGVAVEYLSGTSVPIRSTLLRLDLIAGSRQLAQFESQESILLLVPQSQRTER